MDYKEVLQKAENAMNTSQWIEANHQMVILLCGYLYKKLENDLLVKYKEAYEKFGNEADLSQFLDACEKSDSQAEKEELLLTYADLRRSGIKTSIENDMRYTLMSKLL